MIQTINNRHLSISVKDHGAELCSIKSLKNNKEYLWQADEKYWGKHAPILFPIVGCLKDNVYKHEGKTYTLTRHGFARDNDFQLMEKEEHKLVYRLSSNEETLKKYPFEFDLFITYELTDSQLEVAYEVRNKDNKIMYFSIGAHPAFHCQIDKGDRYLEFSNKVSLDSYQIHGETGLIQKNKRPILQNDNKLHLTYDLFKQDALVFDTHGFDGIAITDSTHEDRVEVTFEGFPYLGIWTSGEGAPFVCIEPWYGIADSIDANNHLEDKKGIQTLDIGDTFRCHYEIKINN